MKHRLAEDCMGVSYGGAQLEVDADGTLDLDAASAAALAPHGLLAQPDRAAADGARSSKRPNQTKPESR